MVALPKPLPIYALPKGDIIQRRIDAKKAAAKRLDYRTPARQPMMSYPLMPWLLHQEVLYRQQVAESQPAKPVSPPIEHPIYHVYHLRKSEVPCNIFYSALCKVVNYVGSFYDCFISAWHFTHA